MKSFADLLELTADLIKACPEDILFTLSFEPGWVGERAREALAEVLKNGVRD